MTKRKKKPPQRKAGCRESEWKKATQAAFA